MRACPRRSSTASATVGSVKLGQPEPDSNFVVGVEQLGAAAGAGVGAVALLVDVLAGQGRSVAGLAQHLVLASGLSSARHSASVFAIFSMPFVSGQAAHERP